MRFEDIFLRFAATFEDKSYKHGKVFKIKRAHSRRRRVRQIDDHGSGRAGQTSVLLSGFLGRGASHSILAGRLAHAVGSAAEARAQSTLQIHQ